ncbi:MAG: hypothetical protein IKK75_09475 [Clostridia bacterium]|nr:hypothetical protein [Clostridia bacterium]
MSEYSFSIIALVIQTAVLLTLIAWTARTLIRERFSEPIAFTAFALACLLLSDLYWIAWALLEPEARLPFAVNEIGECAMFLLLAAALHTQLADTSRFAGALTLLPALFTACNVGLWIAWSGEWIQDIITGLALGWYLVVAVRLMVQDNALPGKAWISLGALSALLVLLQALTFFAPGATAAALDALCYGLMAISILWLLLRCFRVVRLHERAALSLTFGGYGWGLICLYMSSGVPYTLILLCITVMLPLMVVSMKRRVIAP